jgi:uncharacterized protein (TIGR02444 family)
VSLWEFALATYGCPGVDGACLALQDEFGLDVNVILLCLWLGRDGHDIAPVLDRILEVSDEWQAAIVPLRTGRRVLKEIIARRATPGEGDSLAAARERIKACELDVERGEIEELGALAPAGAAPIRPGRARITAGSNLGKYFSAMNLAPGLLGRAEVLRILDAAFAA